MIKLIHLTYVINKIFKESLTKYECRFQIPQRVISLVV